MAGLPVFTVVYVFVNVSRPINSLLATAVAGLPVLTVVDAVAVHYLLQSRFLH